MSVDFVARALATRQQQSSGQAQSFTTLATGIPGVQVPSAVKLLQTSGYAADGIGAGTYVSDALATAALATAHPRFCKVDGGGRHWRLLADDRGLIPVACGGAAGSAHALNVVRTRGLEGFSTAPWLTFQGSLSSGGAGPSGKPGNAVTLTATGNPSNLYLNPSKNIGVQATIKAGTGAFIAIFANLAAGGTTGVWVDPHAGTITLDQTGTATITSLGSGWYQVSVSISGVGNIGLINANASGSINCAVGDTYSVYEFAYRISEASGYAAATDDRPAIQAAIDYCEAIGAAGTRYDAAHYALRRVPRAPTAPFDIHADKSGLLLQINKSHRFISTCAGTTLWRRDTDGSEMGIAKFSTCTGGGTYGWRGGGIFVEGQTSAPADPAENSIYLYDIMLDGGVTDSSEQNNPYGANFNIANGDGWDSSDKGIWQSNDRFCGHIVLEGRSGIRFFMGELIYSSGAGSSIADRDIVLGPDVDIGHTCGSCLNANGHTLKVERCRLHDAFMGMEAWTGHLGGYIKAVVSNCNRNTLQGGIPNYGPGSFFAKARPIASVAPIGNVDLVLQKAGQFDLGSYLAGTVESFDCYPQLGNQAAFTTCCQDVDLNCITWADQTSPLCVDGFLGSASGTMLFDRVSVRVAKKRTDQAATANNFVQQYVWGGGSFGPDVQILVDDTHRLGGYVPFPPASPGYDNAVKVLGWSPDLTATGPGLDIEANNGGTIDLINLGCSVSLTCTHGGSYSVNLPTTGIPRGYRLFLYNLTGNNAPPNGAVCRVAAGNLAFSGGRDLIIGGPYNWAELEFNGAKWVVVVPPAGYTGSKTWDPASVAAGASTSTTLALAGVVVGDRISATFSNDLQGMVLSAYASASGTVTAVLFNPTGSAIDLASGTLKLAVE